MSIFSRVLRSVAIMLIISMIPAFFLYDLIMIVVSLTMTCSQRMRHILSCVGTMLIFSALSYWIFEPTLDMFSGWVRASVAVLTSTESTEFHLITYNSLYGHSQAILHHSLHLTYHFLCLLSLLLRICASFPVLFLIVYVCSLLLDQGM